MHSRVHTLSVDGFRVLGRPGLMVALSLDRLAFLGCEGDPKMKTAEEGEVLDARAQERGGGRAL